MLNDARYVRCALRFYCFMKLNGRRSLVLKVTSRSPKIWSDVLKKMQIKNNQNFDQLFTPQLKRLWSIFEKNNYELRLAGGVVRDLLMGKPAADVDLATTATPSQMREMFTTENVRMFNTNGEKHGTVSVRIDDSENFEITTLRIDVETTGRHARVQFTTDWMLDANRRDLTINSLFLDDKGTIYDYFDGYKHIEKRIVMFVGDANTRIQEDYLRILRYFRFFGVMQPSPPTHIPEILRAIKENAHGLAQISGERIWVELRKILVTPLAPLLLEAMLSCNLMPFIGLEHVKSLEDIEEFKNVCEATRGQKALPITLITALFKDVRHLLQFHLRVHSSNLEKATSRLILMTRAHRKEWSLLSDKEVAWKLVDMYYTLGDLDTNIFDKLCEVAKYMGFYNALDGGEALRCRIETIKEFPVNGHLLAATGLKKGPNYKYVLAELKRRWIESRYTLSCDELLSQLDEVIQKIKDSRSISDAHSGPSRKMMRLSDLKSLEK